MLKPARSLLSSVSAANQAMPYNWNWQRRWSEVSDFLTQNRIILMDVGARGEAPPELDSLLPFVHRVGFEADVDECQRLNDTEDGTFFANLVAGAPGPMSLNLYEVAAYSSVYTLSERFQRLWTGPMAIASTFESEALTLDTFLSGHDDLRPDLLKLDTQGTELEILQGAQASLARIGLIEVEVEFIEQYEGQPLFGDIASYMSEQGFELLYLSRVFANRNKVYEGPSRGQLVYGDALFGRREDKLDDFTNVRLAKYIILLCQYGHMDIAWQILQEHPEVKALVPKLTSVFRSRPPNRIARGALMQVDKALAMGLHARRYNQRGMDTDRAWPIR
ncbi:MAG TPA: FkbM family methyltransferase [Acidimicrobiales bacterium]|nr:FkbM family methyltransferase [Acidimicrobiales bacterium]